MTASNTLPAIDPLALGEHGAFPGLADTERYYMQLQGLNINNNDGNSQMSMKNAVQTGPSMNTIKKSQSPSDAKHPCVYQYGSCSFGDECKFANYNGKICAKFLKGSCSWGNECCWSHSTAGAPIPENNKKGQGRGQRNNNNRVRFNDFNNDANLLQNADHLAQLGGGASDLLQGQMGMGGFGDLSGANAGHFNQNNGNGDFGGSSFGMGNDNYMNDIQRFRLQNDSQLFSEKVDKLKQEIERARLEGKEECERNMRSITLLSQRVDYLVGRLKGMGIDVGVLGNAALPQQTGFQNQSQPQGQPQGFGSGPLLSQNAGFPNAAPQGFPSAAAPQEQLQQAPAPQQAAAAPAPAAQAAPAAVQQAPAAPAPAPPAKKKVCLNCGKEGKLLLCGGCKKATFCDANCQRQAWKKHSKECSPDPTPAAQ